MTDFLHGDLGEVHIIAACSAHCEDVLNSCPSDKILILDVKDGWAPLCEFLGVDIPDLPFSHANDTAAFQKIIKFMKDQGDRILVWCGLGLTGGYRSVWGFVDRQGLDENRTKRYLRGYKCVVGNNLNLMLAC